METTRELKAKTIGIIRTDRGLLRAKPVGDVTHGGTVQVYESSAVEPSVWMKAIGGACVGNQRTVHLSIEDAALLCSQLNHIIANHFLNKDK